MMYDLSKNNKTNNILLLIVLLLERTFQHAVLSLSQRLVKMLNLAIPSFLSPYPLKSYDYFCHTCHNHKISFLVSIPFMYASMQLQKYLFGMQTWGRNTFLWFIFDFCIFCDVTVTSIKTLSYIYLDFLGGFYDFVIYFVPLGSCLWFIFIVFSSFLLNIFLFSLEL